MLEGLLWYGGISRLAPFGEGGPATYFVVPEEMIRVDGVLKDKGPASAGPLSVYAVGASCIALARGFFAEVQF